MLTHGMGSTPPPPPRHVTSGIEPNTVLQYSNPDTKVDTSVAVAVFVGNLQIDDGAQGSKLEQQLRHGHLW